MPEKRESRAVTIQTDTGGTIMFSCTAGAADRLGRIRDEAFRERRGIILAELLKPAE